MLSQFHVENYKCLRNVTVPLTPIHVLIGQNDAGKSSLLEALYAFFRSRDYELAQAFSGQWLADDLVYENASEPCVTFEGTWGRFGKYGMRVEFAKAAKRTCQTVGEWYGQESPEQKSIGQRLNRTAIFRRQHETGLAEEHREIEQEIGEHLDGVHLYRLDPRLMAVPSDLSPKRRFRLDPDGFGLPGLLDDILGYDIEQFAKIRSEFCLYFPQLRSVRVETEQAIRREFRETGLHESGGVVGKGIHFESQSGRDIRAQQASDGAILLLGFLALAHLPNPPRLLLIEEPETGIYPERLGQMIQLLRRMNQAAGEKAPQIVFTTHSPYVLSSFQPEEVTFMSRGEDGAVRARPLRDALHIQERLQGFYLGELWYNLSEQALFADA